ncbi:MAG: hypothetical protein GYB66_07230 [Chloroflexi bacterium]|nr:hypothetical protein [Chloroflexota bacterium]
MAREMYRSMMAAASEPGGPAKGAIHIGADCAFSGLIGVFRRDAPHA